jgi:hypothetical protein
VEVIVKNSSIALGVALGGAALAVSSTLPAYAVSNFDTYGDAGGQPYPCHYGSNYTVPGAPSNIVIDAVRNNCDVRVWLHQYIHYVNRGWALCISPNGPQVIIPAQYGYGRNIQISSNHNPCS